jgi:hypothetical protein
MERRRIGMGVGSRILGVSAESKGEVVSRSLGPSAWRFPVGWRTLAMSIRPVCQHFISESKRQIAE